MLPRSVTRGGDREVSCRTVKMLGRKPNSPQSMEEVDPRSFALIIGLRRLEESVRLKTFVAYLSTLMFCCALVSELEWLLCLSSPVLTIASVPLTV